MAYAEIWDLNTPQGSEARALGDDRIREMKRALQERLQTIMNFPDGQPMTLLPSVLSDLNVHDGTLLDPGSVGGTQLADGSISNAKVPDQTLGWYKLNNNALERLGYVFPITLQAGQSANHSGAAVTVAANAQASWSYPISAIFNPSSVNSAPAMPAGTGVIIGVNAGSGFSGLNPTGFAAYLNWNAYFDGSSLTITVVNIHQSQSIIVNSSCPFNLMFVGSFLANANFSTHAYTNPGSYTPL